MPPAQTPWSDDKVEELKRLWAAGYSATDIAKELAIGVTRCGVLGKVSRLGLKKRKECLPREPEPATVKPRRALLRRPVLIAPAREKPMLNVSPMPPPTQPKPRRLTLLQLADHHCRWPVEGPPVFKFCGAYCKDGGPYCRYHIDKAFVKPRGGPR